MYRNTRYLLVSLPYLYECCFPEFMFWTLNSSTCSASLLKCAFCLHFTISDIPILWEDHLSKSGRLKALRGKPHIFTKKNYFYPMHFHLWTLNMRNSFSLIVLYVLSIYANNRFSLEAENLFVCFSPFLFCDFFLNFHFILKTFSLTDAGNRHICCSTSCSPHHRDVAVAA